MDRSARAYWDLLAARWRFSPPLSPPPEDIAWYRGRVSEIAKGGGAARVLMLGVTPAIASMGWPPGIDLVATDWSVPMLTGVWPRAEAPAGALRTGADWRQLPWPAATFEAAVGDGCYTALASLADYRLLNMELARILKPGGRVVMRCFCRPTPRLEPDPLFEQLLSGEIASLDLFRFLLAMAMYEDSRSALTRREVWQAWARRVPDARALQPRLGWSDDEISNMERNAASDHSFCFPTLDELLEVAREHFDVVDRELPGYAWGRLFPRLTLRAR
jgi:SAM-dependent methyltransferase